MNSYHIYTNIPLSVMTTLPQTDSLSPFTPVAITQHV